MTRAEVGKKRRASDGPSASQRRVLRAYLELFERIGLWPSGREICAHIGILSLNALYDFQLRLERDGFLERNGPPRASRAWKLTELGREEARREA